MADLFAFVRNLLRNAKRRKRSVEEDLYSKGMTTKKNL